jgi:hypothetical protein
MKVLQRGLQHRLLTGEGLSLDPGPCMLLQIVGALHHGKTTLMDMLVEQTHDVPSLGIRTGGRQLRFTDTRVDEQVRAGQSAPGEGGLDSQQRQPQVGVDRAQPEVMQLHARGGAAQQQCSLLCSWWLLLASWCSVSWPGVCVCVS